MKLQTLITAMDYVISRIPDSGASDEEREVAHSATVTRHKVQAWKRSITREKVEHAMQKKKYISENLLPPAEVHTFLNSVVVRRIMEELVEGQEENESTLKR
jgi:gas vesicle protein